MNGSEQKVTICPSCGAALSGCGIIGSDRAGGTSQRCGNPPAIILSKDFNEPEKLPEALSKEELVERLAATGVAGRKEDIDFVIGKVSYGYLHRFCRAIESRTARNQLNIGNALLLILFDKKMKALLLEGIESIELNFRALYSRLMTDEHGAFAHRNADNFKNPEHFDEFLESYGREIDFKTRNHEGRVWEQYCEYGDLPIWEAVNLLGLGTLSKMYRNTRSKSIRFGVCDEFGVSYTYMQSWLRTVCEVRNRCAHFDDICVTPLLCKPKKIKGLSARNDGVFYACVVIQSLIEGGRYAAEGNVQLAYYMDFLGELTKLLNETHDSVIRAAGFPYNWAKQIERASSLVERVDGVGGKVLGNPYVTAVNVGETRQ